jgi:hypothetical protein
VRALADVRAHTKIPIAAGQMEGQLHPATQSGQREYASDSKRREP